MKVQLEKTGLGDLHIIKLRINGEFHHFLIDTGAEKTMLSPELAKDNPVKDKMISAGVGGFTMHNIVGVNFNLLGVGVNNVGVDPKLFKYMTESAGVKISGLIAQDVLNKFKSYTIDNEKGTIEFNL